MHLLYDALASHMPCALPVVPGGPFASRADAQRARVRFFGEHAGAALTYVADAIYGGAPSEAVVGCPFDPPFEMEDYPGSSSAPVPPAASFTFPPHAAPFPDAVDASAEDPPAPAVGPADDHFSREYAEASVAVEFARLYGIAMERAGHRSSSAAVVALAQKWAESKVRQWAEEVEGIPADVVDSALRALGDRQSSAGLADDAPSAPPPSMPAETPIAAPPPSSRPPPMPSLSQMMQSAPPPPPPQSRATAVAPDSGSVGAVEPGNPNPATVDGPPPPLPARPPSRSSAALQTAAAREFAERRNSVRSTTSVASAHLLPHVEDPHRPPLHPLGHSGAVVPQAARLAAGSFRVLDEPALSSAAWAAMRADSVRAIAPVPVHVAPGAAPALPPPEGAIEAGIQQADSVERGGAVEEAKAAEAAAPEPDRQVTAEPLLSAPISEPAPTPAPAAPSRASSRLEHEGSAVAATSAQPEPPAAASSSRGPTPVAVSRLPTPITDESSAPAAGEHDAPSVVAARRGSSVVPPAAPAPAPLVPPPPPRSTSAVPSEARRGSAAPEPVRPIAANTAEASEPRPDDPRALLAAEEERSWQLAVLRAARASEPLALPANTALFAISPETRALAAALFPQQPEGGRRQSGSAAPVAGAISAAALRAVRSSVVALGGGATLAPAPTVTAAAPFPVPPPAPPGPPPRGVYALEVQGRPSHVGLVAEPSAAIADDAALVWSVPGAWPRRDGCVLLSDVATVHLKGGAVAQGGGGGPPAQRAVLQLRLSARALASAAQRTGGMLVVELAPLDASDAAIAGLRELAGRVSSSHGRIQLSILGSGGSPGSPGSPIAATFSNSAAVAATARRLASQVLVTRDWPPSSFDAPAPPPATPPQPAAVSALRAPPPLSAPVEEQRSAAPAVVPAAGPGGGVWPGSGAGFAGSQPPPAPAPAHAPAAPVPASAPPAPPPMSATGLSSTALRLLAARGAGGGVGGTGMLAQLLSTRHSAVAR